VDAEGLIRQASESVRSALDAAQRRADEIVSEAEAEAQRIRATAESEARERLDEVRRALEQLEAGLGATSAPRSASRDSQAPEPKPKAPEPEAEAQEPEPQVSEPQPAPAEPAPMGKVSTEELIEQLRAGDQSARSKPEPAAQASNAAPGDDAGAARLVAMKLALDGTERDEARKQLAAHYELADLDSLLDEVYARAGK
jgi:vacuolar-type H+-ATPase subunit H